MRREENPVTAKPKPKKKREMSSHGNQGQSNSSRTRNHDIKCFKCQGRGHIVSQCLNKRVTELKDDGEIESEDEDDI